jgi:secondary thiamine-phosphate synthase enzyme
MSPELPLPDRKAPGVAFDHDVIHVRTREPLQFVDVTDLVAERVRCSGVAHGMVNVQTLHTTTAVVVNENEPLLLEDLAAALGRWAPEHIPYRHDDLTLRRVNLTPGERANGHAHARALLLGSSETLNVLGGVVQLGRWQRIFLVELDGGRKRSLSVTVMGLAAERVEGFALDAVASATGGVLR